MYSAAIDRAKVRPRRGYPESGNKEPLLLLILLIIILVRRLSTATQTTSVCLRLSILGRILIHGSSHCSILKASSKSTLTYFDPPFIETFSSRHDPTMSDKSQVSAEAAGGGVKPLVGFLGPQASYTHQVGTTNLKKEIAPRTAYAKRGETCQSSLTLCIAGFVTGLPRR